MDDDGVTAGGDQWLTYDAIAVVRGTSRDGAIRWVQRRKLRRQPGNDGRVRVLVPHDMLPNVPPDVLGVVPPKRASRTDTPPGARNDAPDVLPTMAAVFEHALATIKEAHAGEVAALREQLAAAEARADEANIEGEVQQAQEIARLTEQLEAAGADLRAKDAAVTDAEQAARIATDALNVARRTEEARKGRGRWARLRDAWRGE